MHRGPCYEKLIKSIQNILIPNSVRWLVDTDFSVVELFRNASSLVVLTFLKFLLYKHELVHEVDFIRESYTFLPEDIASQT